MKTKNLKLEDFPSQEKAMEAAAAIIASNRVENPDIAAEWPDKISELTPLLDEFYFVCAEGHSPTI